MNWPLATTQSSSRWFCGVRLNWRRACFLERCTFIAAFSKYFETYDGSLYNNMPRNALCVIKIHLISFTIACWRNQRLGQSLKIIELHFFEVFSVTFPDHYGLMCIIKHAWSSCHVQCTLFNYLPIDRALLMAETTENQVHYAALGIRDKFQIYHPSPQIIGHLNFIQFKFIEIYARLHMEWRRWRH